MSELKVTESAAAATSAQPTIPEMESDDWTSPPDGATQGEPLQIEYYLITNKYGDVDNQRGTATVDFGILYTWNDPRLIGWEKDVLPPKLWGPCLSLWNSVGEPVIKQMSFTLTDPATGRVMRNDRYIAEVHTAADESMKWFPFDYSKIAVKFSTASDWRSNDGERFNKTVTERVYVLRKFSDKSMPFFRFWAFDGKLPE